ncbi:MAG: 16S rRNA (uracil(1498)-N(3))-methyltransferase [Deltaproteobacteria bacterium]|nr:16S rRNA (uracil(1498)-N(3))-methyltransferase [Deltaproteobacteria bacterium]
MRRFFAGDIPSRPAGWPAGPAGWKEDVQCAEVRGDEFRHLKNVLRLGPGDEVTLFNGRGLEFEGKIESIGRDFARVRIERETVCRRESPINVVLLQGLVKGGKPELIVQKAVELGVNGIIFYTAERAVPKFDKERAEKKAERLMKVAIGALKQCGRAMLPEIGFRAGFNEAVGGWEDFLKIALYEGEKTRRIKDVLKAGVRKDGIVIIVGPEGGLSDAEVAEARKRGFMPVSLGPRILRAETAAIAAMGILQYELGDMG